MRQFFVLAHENRDDLHAVGGYDLDDFDSTLLHSGQRFEAAIPEGVRLWVTAGDPSDYLGNPLSWAIVSERFWAIICPLVEQDCQTLTAQLYDQETRWPIPGYLLINPIRLFAAVKLRKGETDFTLQDLVIDAARIPAGVHIFRLAESSSVILVSSSILSSVWRKGLKGLAFLRTGIA
jgi:hypothetical protein